MSEGSLTDKGDGLKKSLTPDEFLDKLRRALTRNGDFPASAKIVTELKMLTADPQTTANQIAEVILREPSLGVRVLHLVNSSYYKRSKPITTISQAIVQIGMKPLAEMCAGLVLLQRFVPEARKSSAFASCLRKSIVTSLLSSSLALNSMAEKSGKSANTKNAESGYLAGTMAEMGILLMAYYFPQVYENALKRSESKKQDIATSIKQIIGLSPAQLSSEVIRTLNLPQYYADIVSLAEGMISDTKEATATVNEDVIEFGRCLGAATYISDAISTGQSAEEMVATINDIQSRFNLKVETLQKVINELPKGLQEHCATLEVSLPQFTVDLETLNLTETVPSTKKVEKPTTGPSDTLDIGEHQQAFLQYLKDIQEALDNNEPTASIVTSVMEACAYCLGFNRVLLLLANQGRRALVGRMMLGSIPNFDPTKFSRPIGDDSDPYAPDNNAFMQGRPIFQGDPLFSDGWPIAAIPVGAGKRAVGVVYAERSGGGSKDLSPQEQAAIVMLANLLDKSLQRVALGGS